MTLINGALIPAPRGGFVAYDVNVTAGYALGFAVTNPQNAKPGAEIYCIQVRDFAPRGDCPKLNIVNTGRWCSYWLPARAARGTRRY